MNVVYPRLWTCPARPFPRGADQGSSKGIFKCLIAMCLWRWTQALLVFRDLPTVLVVIRGGTALSLGPVPGLCWPGRAGPWSVGFALAFLAACPFSRGGVRGFTAWSAAASNVPELAFSSFLLLGVH